MSWSDSHSSDFSFEASDESGRRSSLSHSLYADESDFALRTRSLAALPSTASTMMSTTTNNSAVAATTADSNNNYNDDQNSSMTEGSEALPDILSEDLALDGAEGSVELTRHHTATNVGGTSSALHKNKLMPRNLSSLIARLKTSSRVYNVIVAGDRCAGLEQLLSALVDVDYEFGVRGQNNYSDLERQWTWRPESRSAKVTLKLISVPMDPSNNYQEWRKFLLSEIPRADIFISVFSLLSPLSLQRAVKTTQLVFDELEQRQLSLPVTFLLGTGRELRDAIVAHRDPAHLPQHYRQLISIYEENKLVEPDFAKGDYRVVQDAQVDKAMFRLACNDYVEVSFLPMQDEVWRAFSHMAKLVFDKKKPSLNFRASGRTSQKGHSRSTSLREAPHNNFNALRSRSRRGGTRFPRDAELVKDFVERHARLASRKRADSIPLSPLLRLDLFSDDVQRNVAASKPVVPVESGKASSTAFTAAPPQQANINLFGAPNNAMLNGAMHFVNNNNNNAIANNAIGAPSAVSVSNLSLFGAAPPAGRNATGAQPQRQQLLQQQHQQQQQQQQHQQFAQVSSTDSNQVWRLESGDAYQGAWKDGLFHGSGVLHMANGCIYKGAFKDGYFHGFGVFTSPDQTYYKGTWDRGRRHGKGEQRYTDGSIYIGEFDADTRHGHGFITWPDGATYIGGFYKDAMHGVAKFTYSTGTRFEGRWDMGLKDGTGLLYRNDGTIRRLTYKKDVLLASETCDAQPPVATPNKQSSSSTATAKAIQAIAFLDVSQLSIDKQRVLGEGYYGVVYWGSYGERPVAVKTLRLGLPENAVAKFLQEVNMLSQISHPHIVEYLGAAMQMDHTFCIVTEFLAGGTLWEKIHQKNFAFSEAFILKTCLEIASALVYLHNICIPPIIHRDLKSPNILLTQDLRAKVADFGLARHLNIAPDHMTKGVGTAAWSAPEVLRFADYSAKADVYSFAVIMWEMWARQPPFHPLKRDQILIEVAINDARPKLVAAIPPRWRLLIVQCWQKDERKRPTFARVLAALQAMQ